MSEPLLHSMNTVSSHLEKSKVFPQRKPLVNTLSASVSLTLSHSPACGQLWYWVKLQFTKSPEKLSPHNSEYAWQSSTWVTALSHKPLTPLSPLCPTLQHLPYSFSPVSFISSPFDILLIWFSFLFLSLSLLGGHLMGNMDKRTSNRSRLPTFSWAPLSTSECLECSRPLPQS